MPPLPTRFHPCLSVRECAFSRFFKLSSSKFNIKARLNNVEIIAYTRLLIFPGVYCVSPSLAGGIAFGWMEKAA